MKVGTDTVLLGSWTDCTGADRILDVGSGSGIIALMLAQRFNAIIDAVEIDHASSVQAGENFLQSPWKNRLTIHNQRFQDFIKNQNDAFDLVVSNPPYFSNSLKSPDKNRNISRHNDHLIFQELISGSGKILKESGILSVIIPMDVLENFTSIAKIEGFFAIRVCKISGVEGNKPNRVMIEMKISRPKRLITESLHIRENNGNFSKKYIEITREFYLDF